MSLIDDIGSFFLGVTRIESDIESLITDVEGLYENIRAEARKIRKFKTDPKWKNRVINVPAAIDQTRSFVGYINDEIQGAFKSLVSNLRALKSQFRPPDPGGGGSGGGAVFKILGVLEKIRSFVNEIDEGVKALSGFVDALRRIQDELETFDTLFLQQGNTRKVVRDQKATIRVGGLHPS